MRAGRVWLITVALACCVKLSRADVMVVVDMDPATPGIQAKVEVPPGVGVVRGIGLHVHDPSGGHALWGIGYIGGLDRGIALGHMPRNLNLGRVTGLVPHAGHPINPGNAQELLSPAHQPAFTGPEVQYLEFGAMAPAFIRTDPGDPVFTVDVALDGTRVGDVFDFYVLDMVSVWSNHTHGAFSTQAGLSLDTGGDVVPDGTPSRYGVDADAPIPVPPAAYTVDFVDGGALGSAQIVVSAALAVDAERDPPAIRFLPARPNPFRDQVVLRLELLRRTAASLGVYDASGRRVRDLSSYVQDEAGAHAVLWDGLDENGARVAPGHYLCRLAAGDVEITQRLVRLP